MTAAKKLKLIAVEDYLAGELVSPIKHEYLGGVIHAMAGARIAHNVIKLNSLTSLQNRLRGKRCRPFDSDTKIRVQLPNQIRFYYPDGSVVCRSNPFGESFQDEPILLIEVLSRSTRRIDDGEKKDAYLAIPSLSVYLLIEQDMPAVTVYRRTPQGFVREVYEGHEAIIPLSEISAELPLAEVYEGVEFVPEPDEAEI